jgi:aminopeptidase N
LDRILEIDPKNSVQGATYLWTDGGGQAALYAKGPYAFHVMRQTFGDEKFFQFLKDLAAELEGEAIVTRDIQRVASKSFGGGMGWFFDQWIRGVAMPELELTYTSRANEDGSYLIEGEVEQKLTLGQGSEQLVLDGEYFQGILPLTVEMKGSEARLPVVLKGEKTPFQFKVPQKPRKIVVNKYGEILARKVAVNGKS